MSSVPIAECTISTSEKVANYASITAATLSEIAYEAESVSGEITATFTKSTGFVFKGTLTAEDQSKLEALTSLTLGTVKLTGSSGSASGTGSATVTVAEGTATVSELKFEVKDGDTAEEQAKGTVTIPNDKIGSTLKDAASDGSATVSWGTDGETFAGKGAWDDPTSEAITLSNVPTNTTELYVQVKLTGGDNGTYKSDEISITFDDQTATVSDTVNFTKEEPVTVSLSQTEVPVTGQGEGQTAIETLSSGTITLTTDNLSTAAKEVVESVSDLKITFAPSKKASVTGTITLKDGVKSTGASIAFDTGSIAKESMDTVGTIESVTLEGTSGSEEESWTLSKITVNAAAKEEAPATVTATTIEVTGISSIETFSANAPTADAADAITLTPPSGVTPNDAIKGKLKTDGSVEFSAVSLSAADDTAIKTGWKISASWQNSTPKDCTITQADITPTYESASKKLTFDASALTINVAE